MTKNIKILKFVTQNIHNLYIKELNIFQFVLKKKRI